MALHTISIVFKSPPCKNNLKHSQVDEQIYIDILRELNDTILDYALTTKVDTSPLKAKETCEKFYYVNSK